MREFPPGIVWVAAAAASEVEESAAVSRRTPSIWDR
jgi:beta-glucosidase/6-phospho-beta-glucosidase/beta-galactosidase